MGYFSFYRISPGHDRGRPAEPRRAEPGEWPKLEAALAVVNRDVTATLPGQDALVLMVESSGRPAAPSGIDRDHVYVAMPDGRWHGNSVNAYDPDEGEPLEPEDAAVALTVVANEAQSTVVELLWQVWPICPRHGIGMHPRPAGTSADWFEVETDETGPPVWWCRGGRDGGCHDLAPVGELATHLPRARRRAGRPERRGQSGRR